MVIAKTLAGVRVFCQYQEAVEEHRTLAEAGSKGPVDGVGERMPV